MDGFSLPVLQMALWPDWNALSLLCPRRQAFYDSSFLRSCVKPLRAKHLHPPENPESKKSTFPTQSSKPTRKSGYPIDVGQVSMWGRTEVQPFLRYHHISQVLIS